jgi:hypothetical protein
MLPMDVANASSTAPSIVPKSRTFPLAATIASKKISYMDVPVSLWVQGEPMLGGPFIKVSMKFNLNLSAHGIILKLNQ